MSKVLFNLDVMPHWSNLKLNFSKENTKFLSLIDLFKLSKYVLKYSKKSGQNSGVQANVKNV